MFHGSSKRRSVPARVMFVAFCSAAAWAAPFDYFETFGDFGVTPNFQCGKKFACGAVASINSFLFLENKYPNIYDNKLTPGADRNANTDQVDGQEFGFDGWNVTGTERLGYYNRTGTAAGDFLGTKEDWINDHAPHTTVFDSWYAGSSTHNRVPTSLDLGYEIRDQEDVEFFVQGTNFFHVLTLTAVKCDDQGKCSIRYQDPNDPKVEQKADLTNTNGKLTFTGVPGSKYAGTVTITAEFAESPVPEPATLLAIGAALAILAVRRRPSTWPSTRRRSAASAR